MAIKRSSGGGSVKRTERVPSSGGVAPTGIGTTGPIRSGGTAPAGGGHFDHLPPAGSFKNGDVTGKGHNPAPCKYTKPGPTWDHLPANPAATKESNEGY